jgi:thiol-disulfide isomerase/thioredoxin
MSLFLWTCSDDSGSPNPISGGDPGGACACDSDCAQYGNWNAFCFKGVCMLEPNDDCSAQNACPANCGCIELTHEEEIISACTLRCDDPEKKCLGTCDADNLCVPAAGDNCLMGCCTVAEPPIEQPDPPEYPEQEWEEPTCGADIYPCPPYGTRRNRIMADIGFLPANDAAETLAGSDGVLSMKDFYAAEADVIFIFVSADWCPYCTQEAYRLQEVYDSFADDSRGKVMFLGILAEDDGYNPATLAEAEAYATARGWEFPAAPDVNGFAQRYFVQPAYPFHLFINGRTMKIERALHAALTSSEVSDNIEAILND